MSIAATTEPTVFTEHPAWHANSPPRPAPPSSTGDFSHASDPADQSRARPGPLPPAPALISPGGRLMHPGMTTEEKHCAVAIHLSPLAGLLFPVFFFTPLVLWLIQKDKSAYLDDHGREMINFAVTAFLANVVLGISFIGWPLMPILWVVWLISVIRGAVAASNGEYFRYPLTIRFLS